MFGYTKLYHKWGFLQCDHDIGKYYRSLFLLQFGIKLQRPSNGEHITIITPEDNIDLSSIKSGDKFLFNLLSRLWSNGNALWLDVISDDIMRFRNNLGLSDPIMPPHFCIGYFYDNNCATV